MGSESVIASQFRCTSKSVLRLRKAGAQRIEENERDRQSTSLRVSTLATSTLLQCVRFERSNCCACVTD